MHSFHLNGYPIGTGQRDVHEQDSKSWALFTNNNIKFTDALELTLGLRYTNESKDLDTLYTNTHAPAQGCSLRNNFAAFQATMVAPD